MATSTTANSVAAVWFLKIEEPGHHRRVALGQGGMVTIGSAQDAAVRLAGLDIAPHHARLAISAEGVLVTDLGSAAGTWSGGGRVSEVLVRDGAAVRCGCSVLRFERRVRTPSATLPGIVGRSAQMLELREQIAAVAPLSCSVLILGESGSGKDVVARAIHQLSRRKGAFVPLNVGGLSESLADSELFGHHRGAFTGAVERRAGAFAEARGGTLFLDEVADMAPQVQVKLLRAIENKEVRALGGAGATSVDCRVISACWAPIEERSAAGKFRIDLYHRLATIVLRVPPLRARRADIPALCEHLLGRHGAELGTKRVSEAALSRLVSYSWPGNVRELSAVLYRAAAFAPGAVIDEQHVHLSLPTHAAPKKCHDPVDVRALLRAHQGNISAAARAAGMPRSTFRSRLGRELLGSALRGLAAEERTA